MSVSDEALSDEASPSPCSPLFMLPRDVLVQNLLSKLDSRSIVKCCMTCKALFGNGSTANIACLHRLLELARLPRRLSRSIVQDLVLMKKSNNNNNNNVRRPCGDNGEGESYVDVLRFVETTAHMAGELMPVAGESTSLLLSTHDGAVYACGANTDGALPTVDVDDKDAPFSCLLASPKTMQGSPRFVDGAAGFARTALVDATGKLHLWGRSDGGHLGASREMVNAARAFGSGAFGAAARAYAAQGPKVVPFSRRVVSVAVGRLHMLVATSDGLCWSWGSNTAGQLGHGSLLSTRGGAFLHIANDDASDDKRPARLDEPRVISQLRHVSVRRVASQCFSSAAVTTDNELFLWGDNRFGQLGQGDAAARDEPVLVNTERFVGLHGEVADVALGRNHTLALTRHGHVWTWGSNHVGQLGQMVASAGYAWPKRVALDTDDGHQVCQLAAGFNHSVVLTCSGDVLTAGDNASGELGRRGDGAWFSPVELPGPASYIAAGARHTMITLAMSSVIGVLPPVVCFGKDNHGQVSGWQWEVRSSSTGRDNA